jgi:hypothetical protein
MARLRRFDIKELLKDPDLRRRMIVRSTIATQAREGIDVSHEEAENSYYVVSEGERAAFFGLAPFRTETGENDGRHAELVKSLSSSEPRSRIDITLADFSAIDGSPLSYDRLGLVAGFFKDHPRLDPITATAAQGLATANDPKYVRCWWEVQKQTGWIPFAKGGEYCRFYADVFLCVQWRNDGEDIRSFDKAFIRNESLYQQSGLTWPLRTQRGFNIRLMPEGCIFGHKGPAIIPKAANQNYYLLGVLNSNVVEFMLRCFSSFGAWEVGAVKKVPVPTIAGDNAQEIARLAKLSFDCKSSWDTGNEICTRFDRPWILQADRTEASTRISSALDRVLEAEANLDVELQSSYAQINDAVYRLYGVSERLLPKLKSAIGKRPPEIVWPQMEGKDRDQKRREHVDRLLCYLVKRIVEADEDGLVCFESVAHEPPLLARLRKELCACFPQQDPSTLETEVVNELKKKTKGYRRAETLTEWLQDAFFDTHSSLYQQRPLIWHLASNQTRRVPAIGVLVHAHKFNADALAKLRGTHLRDRLATLRREAGQASQDGREDDRLEALAAIEELEAYDAKLKHLQDGHHTGPEGSDRDYRILTPWKSPSERPQGWNPDLDDGIKVNIAPLARTNLLRRKMRLAEVEKDE